MQSEILKQRVAGRLAFLIAVLFCQERRYHQWAELAVPRPARGNLDCPADRRYHDLHVVRIGVIVHPDRRLYPGSALSRTISPRLCGNTGLASNSRFSASFATRLGGSSKNRAVSMLMIVRKKSSLPPVRKQMISVSCLSRSPRRLEQKTTASASDDAPKPRPVACHSASRFSASCFNARSSGDRVTSAAGSAGNGPAGARNPSGPIARATSFIGTPIPGAG